MSLTIQSLNAATQSKPAFEQTPVAPRLPFYPGNIDENYIVAVLDSFVGPDETFPASKAELLKQKGEAWDVSRYYDNPQNVYNKKELAKRIVKVFGGGDFLIAEKEFTATINGKPYTLFVIKPQDDFVGEWERFLKSNSGGTSALGCP